jgi:hypothetical protein
MFSTTLRHISKIRKTLKIVTLYYIITGIILSTQGMTECCENLKKSLYSRYIVNIKDSPTERRTTECRMTECRRTERQKIEG